MELYFISNSIEIRNRNHFTKISILFQLPNNSYFLLISFFLSILFSCRTNNNWQTNYASITKSNENSSQTTKKQRDIGETARDSLAYSCLLKNELLGNGIEDVKTVADDRNENVVCSAKRGLFKYQSPTKQVCLQFAPMHIL